MFAFLVYMGGAFVVSIGIGYEFGTNFGVIWFGGFTITASMLIYLHVPTKK